MNDLEQALLHAAIGLAVGVLILATNRSSPTGPPVNHLEQIRLDAATKLAELHDPQQTHEEYQTSLKRSMDVVDAIATYAIAAFVRAPDHDPAKHAIHAAGSDSLDRKKRRQGDDPGTTPDPTHDG